jgi:hypothetical protein
MITVMPNFNKNALFHPSRALPIKPIIGANNRTRFEDQSDWK